MPSKIPKKMLIIDLKRVNEEVDGYMSFKDYKQKGVFSPKTIVNHFGSFAYGKLRAGIAEDYEISDDGEIYRKLDSAKDVTKKMVLEDVKQVAKNHFKSLSLNDYEVLGNYSRHYVDKYFGGWNNLKQELGLRVVNITEDSPYAPDNKEDVLSDIKETSKNIEGYFSMNKYREKGSYPVSFVYKYFDSWIDAKQEAGIVDTLKGYKDTIKEMLENGYSVEEISDVTGYDVNSIKSLRVELIEPVEEAFEKWAEVLKPLSGWFKNKELKKIIDEKAGTLRSIGSVSGSMQEFVEWANENTDLDIRRQESKSYPKYYIHRGNYDYEDYKEKLPGKYKNHFNYFVGQGRSPDVVIASILYYEFGKNARNGVTQQEIADEWDITTVSIRNFLKKYEDKLDEIRENT